MAEFVGKSISRLTQVDADAEDKIIERAKQELKEHKVPNEEARSAANFGFGEVNSEESEVQNAANGRFSY